MFTVMICNNLLAAIEVEAVEVGEARREPLNPNVRRARARRK
jgi:hypothetical protein